MLTVGEIEEKKNVSKQNQNLDKIKEKKILKNSNLFIKSESHCFVC